MLSENENKCKGFAILILTALNINSLELCHIFMRVTFENVMVCMYVVFIFFTISKYITNP